MRSAAVGGVVMRFRDLQVSTRFFAALAVLLMGLIGMAVVGLTGLAAVDSANQQVFADNLRTTDDTNRVEINLARVEILSVAVLATNTQRTVEVLRAQLHQIVIPSTSASIATLVRIHAGDPASEHAQIERIPAGWQAFLPLTRRPPLSTGSARLNAAGRAAEAAEVRDQLDPLIAFVSARQSTEINAAARAHAAARHTYAVSRLWLIVAAAVALLAAIVLVRAGLTLRRLLTDQADEQDHGQSVSEYIELLQATESEGEAQELLRRQLQRTQPGTRVIVLNRNNSADRLEPRTSLAELNELRGPLEQTAPRSCLAVRFAHRHTEDHAESSLTTCEICGGLPGTSTCEPLLVGGEVIGSVLVAHSQEPDTRARQRISETVAQAAPVLGNLRNLAIAELRAATDRLTGLPNQRAVQDTLKRMVAQASRTITPLTAILVDLDHFKQINDLYGHDRGDEVLAAAGVALRNAVRESDFVGRYGGEEFLLLLPDTDTDSALQVAEAVRVAISAVRVASIEHRITASAGVATLPRDAGDSVTLFRAADRALYAAKNNGRDRVQTAVAQPSPIPSTPHVP
jgi:diguanylate cyclase (GGDEF)-like protein